MTAEAIVSMVFMVLCTFGCGVLFLYIGIRAKRSAIPANFWAHGPSLKAEDCRDVTAYNHAFCKMWVKYSIWYFAAGAFAALEYWLPWAIWVSISLLFLSVLPGLVLLILEYKRTEKMYLLRA